MAKPYSLDLRERIVRAVEAGSSRRGAAEQFAVSESCAIKLVQRWRRTGSVAPGRGRKKAFALAGHEACVRALLAAQPDATLEELKAQLAGQGIMVGRSSVDRFLKALGMTRKKRHSTPPSRLVPTSPKPGSRGGSTSRS
jgi:transposase